jgi:hypothetical protein
LNSWVCRIIITKHQFSAIKPTSAIQAVNSLHNHEGSVHSIFFTPWFIIYISLCYCLKEPIYRSIMLARTYSLFAAGLYILWKKLRIVISFFTAVLSIRRKPINWRKICNEANDCLSIWSPTMVSWSEAESIHLLNLISIILRSQYLLLKKFICC